VQRTIYGLYVSADGTCYTNSLYDESGQEAGIYKAGDYVGRLPGLHGRDRIAAGRAITGDGTYIYYAAQRVTVADSDHRTWYVGRARMDESPAPWPGLATNFLSVSTVKNEPAAEGAAGEIWGLATSEGELFVATADPDEVLVYDSASGILKRSFAVQSPGAIIVDHAGYLWVVQRPAIPGSSVETNDHGLGFQVIQYTRLGQKTGRQLPFVARPEGLSIDMRGRILVADDGPAQQILTYDVSGEPRLASTFGDKEGLQSGLPGEEADLKLPYPIGIGEDAKGDVFVASRYPVTGSELRAFAPSGRMLWRLYSDQFMNTSDIDPATDGEIVYSPRECFHMDFSRSPGQEATLVGHTVDGFQYPDDPRLHGDGDRGYAPLMRRIDGHLFMYLIGPRGRVAVFRRVTPGYRLAPCALFSNQPISGDWPVGQPLSGRWLWLDTNGDGRIQPGEISADGVQMASNWNQWVDDQGNIWTVDRTRIFRLPFMGLDRNGNPLYSLNTIEDEGIPDQFAVSGTGQFAIAINRIEYDVGSDLMYVAGYTDGPCAVINKRGSVFARGLGPELFCYQHWRTAERTLKWRIAIPYNPTDETGCCGAFSTTADYVFVAAIGGDGNQSKIWVYSTHDGRYVSTITPGPNVGPIGWIDTPEGIRAYQRKDGEILLFVEDDWKEKQVMYRIDQPIPSAPATSR
jgi:hypothetical protein